MSNSLFNPEQATPAPGHEGQQVETKKGKEEEKKAEEEERVQGQQLEKKGENEEEVHHGQ
jgi:hypothetical protein